LTTNQHWRKAEDFSLAVIACLECNQRRGRETAARLLLAGKDAREKSPSGIKGGGIFVPGSTWTILNTDSPWRFTA
jgi:hypothetical protein